MKVRIYNKNLNPEFWSENNALKPEIKTVLLKIAKTFINDTKLDVGIKDVYFLGSSANYNWTDISDLDLHILIDFSALKMSEEHAKMLTKTLAKNWNEENDVSIKNHDVEVYIQNVSEENRSTGVYSLIKNDWVKPATPLKIVLDKPLIQQKYTTWVQKIDKAIQSQNVVVLKKVLEDLVNMREIGLTAQGEFSTENLVFKILRQSGNIGKLKDSIQKNKNKNLSMKEIQSQ